MLTNGEIMEPMQHMGCEEMDMKLIESNDEDVDIEPSKITILECRESLKGIANIIAQDVCLGDEATLQVQRLLNKVLAPHTACVMNRKQEEIKEYYPVVDT